MFSPDGRWLAYTSNESGSYQVYVRAFPERGGKWQISNGGGSYPVWSHNGRELFFRSGDNRTMVAGYTAKGDSFVADQPKVWSEKQLAVFGITGNPTCDVAPDGKRIAALMPVETPENQQYWPHHSGAVLYPWVMARSSKMAGARSVRQSVTLPAALAVEVRRAARKRKVTMSKALVALAERGVRAEADARAQLKQSYRRFVEETEPGLKERAGQDLIRAIFGRDSIADDSVL